MRDTLPRLVKRPGVKIPVPELLDDLARALPVLDGGTHRSAVLSRVAPKTLTLPAAGELSSALAHALFRLEDDETISLFNESDTDKRLLPIESGNSRPYSHIRIDRMPEEMRQ